jgi:DNA repair protein RadC
MESTNEKKIFEVAEIQLSYKSKVKASMRPKITGSKDAHNVLREYWDTDKLELVEQFKVMLLNRANQVISLLDLSTGSTTGSIADSRLIFCTALKGKRLRNHRCASYKKTGESIFQLFSGLTG